MDTETSIREKSFQPHGNAGVNWNKVIKLLLEWRDTLEMSVFFSEVHVIIPTIIKPKCIILSPIPLVGKKMSQNQETDM